MSKPRLLFYPLAAFIILACVSTKNVFYHAEEVKVYAKRRFVEMPGPKSAETLIGAKGMRGVYSRVVVEPEFVPDIDDYLNSVAPMGSVSQNPMDTCFIAEAWFVCLLIDARGRNDTMVVGWPAGMRVNQLYYHLDAALVERRYHNLHNQRT